ncbi:hypothetical protein BTN49_0797 [Candidatus Enterovibrio escicola]|uniref:Uncharacterized protein n=1 Tax=Candidatus Enterovibrio escicola TaxID=1927127 RepID=A0A2A5T6S1_9GAMM|nr:hypothetical protein BTN49_0797 [Candidatus Enterovibrio escacola]
MPTIKNKVFIDEQPSFADGRERFDNWKISTILGKIILVLSSLY